MRSIFASLLLSGYIFPGCLLEPQTIPTYNLNLPRELQGRPQHQCYTGMRGLNISETNCDGSVCLELQFGSEMGVKFCPKRRVGWPRAIHSCRIEMCSFLDHFAARGLRKKGNTYCAFNYDWMLCCCRGRLCNSERLSYIEKGRYEGGDVFNTTICPPKEKLWNSTLRKELPKEDFYEFFYVPEEQRF